MPGPAPVSAARPSAAAPAPPGRSPAALRAWQELGRRLDPRDPAVVRSAATQLVAELFFVPLLAEMRRFPPGRELAVGGQTESAFGALLDQRLADTAAAHESGLTARVVRALDARRARAARGAPPAKETP